MPPLNGIICDTLTFYNKDFRIIKNLNSLLIRHVLTNDANSLLFFGRLGDGDLFSTGEKIRLIELALEITEKRVPILVGIFGNEIDGVLNQIENLGKKFEDINFMISPPFSEKLSIDAMKSYFENILGSNSFKNQIYLINNPPQFAGNEIEPNLLKNLIEFTNLKGLNDSFYNIKKCKSYIQLINKNFSVFCGLEENAQNFFQLVPLEQRKYSGIVSNISNLVNICSKLYKYALEDNILELLQLQEQINDIRNKIYEIKTNEIKEKVGLKYAFFYLYKDLISSSVNETNYINEKLYDQIDPISKERIEATLNYLLNNKQIYQLYFLGKKDLYQFDEIIKTFSNIEVLVQQGKVKKIKGPYIIDVNTLYRVKFENSQLVFRFRTDPYSLLENLVKEKLLYPFLDKSLNPNELELTQKVKEIINTKKGAYIFSKERPPIIPVCNLIYFDETKETVPYIFSVQEYIRGKPLFQLINQYINEGKNLYTKKFQNLFSNLGEHLGNLHQIKFDSYYKSIKNIGKKLKLSYSEFFEHELEEKLYEVKKNKIDFCDEIRDFYRDNRTLIDDETEYVLLHNDFKSQNIIVKEELGAIKINGIVDFDNWCVGSRAQDFIKIDYWILKPLNNPLFYRSFYDTYSKFSNVDNDFKKKIEIYKLLWLLDEYNFESELIKKSTQIDIISSSSASLENYLFEIKAIIR
ncbi:MAG: dihydrodipicolinate synthase family protein [Promethearchaeota archaeon]|nr:MAG: dihydrodipicolinate synthase family protein [Candidatus Lokiarchaeota archaeon]